MSRTCLARSARAGAIASKEERERPMIAKFLPYLKAHRWQVALALGQVFLVAAFELLKPWPLQIVIDYVLGGKSPPSDGSVGDLLSLPTPMLLLFACIALVVAHF